MADITLTVNSTTQEETRAAQFALARANDRRAQRNLPPHASVTEFLEDRIVNWLLPAWIRDEREANVQEADVQTRWQLSTDAERAAALAELAPIPTGV